MIHHCDQEKHFVFHLNSAGSEGIESYQFFSL